MLDRFGHVALHKTISEFTVETQTLDTACERFDLAPPDYLKIDVEGAELGILSSAPRSLVRCSAIKVEVSFLEQRLWQPLMHEVVDFMLHSRFILADIRGLYTWRRRPLPTHPYSAVWRVPYSRGIPAQCDLIFLRDPARSDSDEHLLRLLCVSAILGFFDHVIVALRQSSKMNQALDERFNVSFVDELGNISRLVGREAAISAIKGNLRSLIPLTKSTIKGIAMPNFVVPGY
jgi:hypothetical protein